MPGAYTWQIKVDTDLSLIKSKLSQLENQKYTLDIGVNADELDKVIKNLNKMLDSLGKNKGDFSQFETLSKNLTEITAQVKNLSKAFGTVDDNSGLKSLVQSINSIDTSLTSLAEHIKTVGVKSAGIDDAATGIQNIGNASKDAAKGVEALADAEKKLGSGKSGGSSSGSAKKVADDYKKAIEDVNKYKKAVDALAGLRQKQATSSGNKVFDTQLKDAEKEVVKLGTSFKDACSVISSYAGKTESELKSFGLTLANVQKQQKEAQNIADPKNQLKASTVDAYSSFYNNANSRKASFEKRDPQTKGYAESLSKLTESIGKYKTVTDKIKADRNNGIVNTADVKNAADLKKQITELMQTMSKMTSSEAGTGYAKQQGVLGELYKLKNEFPGMSKEMKVRIQALEDSFKLDGSKLNVDKAMGQIRELRNELMQTADASKNLWSSIKDKAFYGLAAQISGMFSFYDAINAVRNGINSIHEMDTAFTELRKVSDESVSSLKEYQDTTFATADSVGATAQTIMDSTANWKRLGESMSDAAESAKISNVLLNVSEFDNIDEATKSLVSMSQAYKDLDKIDIVDKLNNIGVRRNIWKHMVLY